MSIRPSIIASTLALLTFSNLSSAQTDRPKAIEFYGVVRGADGQPSKACEVTMVAPSANKFDRFFAREVIATPPEVISTSTHSDGTFQFKIDLTNTKWLGAGEGLIIARSAAGEMALEPYRLSRGLVDLPLELSLGPVGKVSVRVVDKTGQAVVGARVAPARFGKIDVAFSLAESFQATTNQEGVVELPATNQPLSAVFVVSESLGHQFLLTQETTPGKLQAVTLKSTPRRILCVPPENTKPTDIGRIEWHLVSFQKSNEQMELAWQRVITNGTEAITVALPEGSFAGFSDAHTGHGWLAADRGFEIADQSELELKLQRGLHVTGQVVAKENGRPLAGIGLYTNYSTEPTSTREDGSFDMWLPKISDGTYPSDPLEEYFSEDAFFERPQAEHAPGEAKIKPFELTRRTTTVGTVLDAEGKPVAGVTVKCECKQERFTNNHEYLTDRNGSFRMTNIADGTPVKLKVMDVRGITESPLEVTVSPSTSPVVRLVKPAPKRFTGRIVGGDGKPIVGATVEVQLGRVLIAEGYRSAEYAMENAFDQPSFKRNRFTTDDSGRFETDECIDWQNVFGLKVNHLQHYETLSWVRRVDKTPASQERYDFGDLQMRATPLSQKFTVQVKDKTGAAVSQAKVLFIQGRDFADQGHTDTSGQVSFEGKRTTGIVAVREQQRVAFATFNGTEPQIKVNIDSITQDQPWKELPGSSTERRAAVGKLLKKFELAKSLDLVDSADGEVVCVVDAVIYANPTVVVQLATTKRAELEKRPQVASMLIGQAVSRNPELGPALIPFMPAEYQQNMYLQLASKSGSGETREEHIAQAVALTRKLAGDEAAVAAGRVAMELLTNGDIDLATELVNDVYKNQKKDFESATEQRGKRGVARYYFPQVALLDFDAACQLIRTHAYPIEIESLQTLALTLAVMANKTDWKSGLDKLGRASLGESESSVIPGRFGETPLPNEEFVESLLEQMQNEKIKARLCIQASLKLPDVTDNVRKRWLNRGVEHLSKAKADFPSFFTETLAYTLREQFPKLGKIDAAAARQLTFLCLEEMSEFRDGQFYYLPDRAGFVAEVLVGVDVELSRTLLKPFLEDFTWHYRNGFRFGPQPLTSAARVDPQWACTIAEQLFDGPLREDKLRQAETLKSVVDGLALPH